MSVLRFSGSEWVERKEEEMNYVRKKTELAWYSKKEPKQTSQTVKESQNVKKRRTCLLVFDHVMFSLSIYFPNFCVTFVTEKISWSFLHLESFLRQRMIQTHPFHFGCDALKHVSLSNYASITRPLSFSITQWFLFYFKSVPTSIPTDSRKECKCTSSLL